VRVFINGKPMGDTDSTGFVRAQVRPQSDQPLRVEYDCPEGYQESTQAKALRLRQFEGIGASVARGMEITLRCRPTKRLAVFIVRAKNGSDIPVLLDGETVARTSASGVTQFSTRSAPGTEHSIQLDTREQARLRPKSPIRAFMVPNADEIFVFNQSFEMDKEPAPARRHRTKIIKIE